MFSKQPTPGGIAPILKEPGRADSHMSAKNSHHTLHSQSEEVSVCIDDSFNNAPADSSSSQSWLPVYTVLLIIGYWNATSLVNRLTPFQSFVYSTCLDVFLITEIWLTDSIYDSEFLPNGYSVYRLDRNSRIDGVAIVAKSTLFTSFHSRASYSEAITIKLHPYLLHISYLLGIRFYIYPSVLEGDYIF